MTTNTYTKLRKNASLVTVANASRGSAARAWKRYHTFRADLPKGFRLLTFEEQTTLTRLFEEATERDELARHLERLAS